MKNNRKTEQSPASDDPRRRLASVSVLLERPEVHDWLRWSSRPLVISAIRQALEYHRKRLAASGKPPEVDEILGTASAFLLNIEGERIRPVINATGVILHPDLGRAVLPQAAVDALAGMNRYCNSRMDMAGGGSGKTVCVAERLLCELTGAEAAEVVNNDAAAIFLVLAALSRDREVIVSRSHLMEAEGTFRLRDYILQSGARPVPVGTTNKTHLRDFENAITARTAAILHVRPVSYRIAGFTGEVPLAELVALSGKRDLIVIDDLESGALIDLSSYGLPGMPTVADSLEEGADLVCFRADLLLGGPKAGIIAGREGLIREIRKHPLARMLRPGKLDGIALEKTLRLFTDPEALPDSHPTLRMIAARVDTLRERAARLLAAVSPAETGVEILLVDGESALVESRLPVRQLKTVMVALRPLTISPEELGAVLRRHEPPVIARIEHDRVLLDLRTVREDEEAHIADAIRRATALCK